MIKTIAVLFAGIFLVTSSYTLRDDDDYANGAWRKSLDSCWTDRSCQRVMTCAHGGEWNVTFPYDSFPAMQQAYFDGADAVKGGNNLYFSRIIFSPRLIFFVFFPFRFPCCQG